MAHRKWISPKRNPQIDYIETSHWLSWKINLTKNVSFLKKAFLTLVLGYQFLWLVSCPTAQKSSKISACRKNLSWFSFWIIISISLMEVLFHFSKSSNLHNSVLWCCLCGFPWHYIIFLRAVLLALTFMVVNTWTRLLMFIGDSFLISQKKMLPTTLCNHRSWSIASFITFSFWCGIVLDSADISVQKAGQKQNI